jgi:hypothetical protein
LKKGKGNYIFTSNVAKCNSASGNVDIAAIDTSNFEYKFMRFYPNLTGGIDVLVLHQYMSSSGGMPTGSTPGSSFSSHRYSTRKVVYADIDKELFKISQRVTYEIPEDYHKGLSKSSNAYVRFAKPVYADKLTCYIYLSSDLQPTSHRGPDHNSLLLKLDKDKKTFAWAKHHLTVITEAEKTIVRSGFDNHNQGNATLVAFQPNDDFENGAMLSRNSNEFIILGNVDMRDRDYLTAVKNINELERDYLEFFISILDGSGKTIRSEKATRFGVPEGFMISFSGALKVDDSTMLTWGKKRRENEFKLIEVKAQ